MTVAFWVLVTILSYFAFLSLLDTVDKAIQRWRNKDDGSRRK